MPTHFAFFHSHFHQLFRFTSMNKNWKLYIKINKSHRMCSLPTFVIRLHIKCEAAEVRETITQRSFPSEMLSIYVATLNCHYVFNTRSKLYTNISSPASGIKNYSRDALLRLKTQTAIDVHPGDSKKCWRYRNLSFISSSLGSPTENVKHNWGNQIDCGTKIGSSSSVPLYQNRFMNMSNICPSNKWARPPRSQNETLCIYLTCGCEWEWNIKMRRINLSANAEWRRMLHKSYFKSSRLQ